MSVFRGCYGTCYGETSRNNTPKPYTVTTVTCFVTLRNTITVTTFQGLPSSPDVTGGENA